MAETTTSPQSAAGPSDARKRVNHTAGLVLGVDEFVQDQTYLRGRDHLASRSLHGYGTVCGLRVRWDHEQDQLRVAAGLAIDPAGRLVCVPSEQRIDVADWLTRHRAAIAAANDERPGEVPDELALFLVLCHRDLETDPVPVSSRPGRPGGDTTVASRILDSFELQLRSTPPADVGELAGGALHAGALRATIDRLLTIVFEQDVDGGEGEVAGQAVRRELIAWATDARPEVAAGACAPSSDGGGDHGDHGDHGHHRDRGDHGDHGDEPATAVLLARVHLGIVEDGKGRLAPVDALVEDRERPLLLTTRFLQEWLIGLVEHLALAVRGDHRSLRHLDGDDHPHDLPADGTRPLRGDLDAGGHTVANLRASSGPTHPMRRDEVVGSDLTAGRDGLRIARLQGEELSASGEHAPRPGDVLVYDGHRWVPARLPDTDRPDGSLERPDRPRRVLTLATVESLGRNADGSASFLVWFHLEGLDASAVLAPVDGAEPLAYGENLVIRTETCDGDRLRSTRIATNRVAVRQLGCNRFRVDVARREAEYLRFELDLRRLRLGNGQDVARFSEQRGIGWVGQADLDLVTVFVHDPTPRPPREGSDER